MMINSDMKQVNLYEVNLILEVLQSFVSQSIESRICQEEEEVMSKLSPILSCFASVIQFVKTGCVKIPQDLVTQFLVVASILNIVNTEKKREWDTNRRDDGEDDNNNDGGNKEDHDAFGDSLWWDDGYQYQLYWCEDDDTFGSDVFSLESSEGEEEEEYSVAHRVKARRARLGATTAADWVPASSTCTAPPRRGPTPSGTSSTPPSSTTPPRSRRRSNTNPKGDPFINTVLRAFRQVTHKSTYNRQRAETLRAERKAKRVSEVVPDVFQTLWDTVREEEEVPVDVPDPYPVLDWSKVNERFIKNIPRPDKFPKHGCSIDPEFYQFTSRFITGTSDNIKPKFQTELYPFGSEFGYSTSEGIISVTSMVHHGYIWDASGGWILYAQKPKVEVEEKVNKRKYKGEANMRRFRGRGESH